MTHMNDGLVSYFAGLYHCASEVLSYADRVLCCLWFDE